MFKKMCSRLRDRSRYLVKSYYATTWPRLADYTLNNYVYVYIYISYNNINYGSLSKYAYLYSYQASEL